MKAPATVCSSPARGRGFTLIELIATLVLLTLVASLSIVILTPNSRDATIETTAAAVQRVDAQARLEALRVGPVRLGVNSAGDAITATYLEAVAGHARWDSTVEVPEPNELIEFRPLPDDTEARSAIVIDGAGRSPDYRVTIGSAERWAVVEIAGLTGWAEVTWHTPGVQP